MIKRCKHRKDINHNLTRILVTIVLIGTKVSMSIFLVSGRDINSNANPECRCTKNTCDIGPAVRIAPIQSCLTSQDKRMLCRATHRKWQYNCRLSYFRSFSGAFSSAATCN